MTENTETERQKRSLQNTLCVIGIVMALGLVVFWSQLKIWQELVDEDRLPVIKQLDRSLEGVNQKGEPVSLAQLRGKVWVLGYIYTRCPAGCTGVMSVMKGLQEKFGHRDNFHLVALSLEPEKDTPEWMDKWAQEREMGGENWWFMTGDGKTIRDYMRRYFFLHATKREDPNKIEVYGEWEHEFKLVLVDQAGAIRYYYDVLNVSHGERHREKLNHDIDGLLKHGPERGGARGKT